MKRLLPLLFPLIAIAADEQLPPFNMSIERLDSALDALIAPDAKVEKLAGGFAFTEGPIWFKREEYLLFSDIPRNEIHKWTPDGKVALFRKPSGYDGNDAPAGAFIGSNGMTLYTFDKDTAGSGKSVCNGQCATNWPPLMAADADAASGDYSLVTRDDGKKQWALKGKPLYYWIKDTKPGDTTGEGVMGAWHVAKP